MKCRARPVRSTLRQYAVTMNMGAVMYGVKSAGSAVLKPRYISMTTAAYACSAMSISTGWAASVERRRDAVSTAVRRSRPATVVFVVSISLGYLWLFSCCRHDIGAAVGDALPTVGAGGGQSPMRWRTTSKSMTAAAAETLSDSTAPMRGMASCSSQSLSTSFEIPFSSEPITMAVGRLRSAS